ncbi:MAG TPA: hypothetical protein VNL12_17890 [Iamia sp.]|nr:hypothetical protein [Iamia sp.]HXH59162.1 hypothetical protein [Iamia sp.]
MASTISQTARAVDRPQLAPLVLLGDEAGHVEAFVGVDAALGVADGHDAVAIGVEEPGDVLSGVAEPLHGDGDVLRVPPLALLDLFDGVVGAAPRGLGAPEAAAEGEGLAGDDRRGAAPLVLGVLVHHPAHHHGVGVDVGRGDVGVGPDEVAEGDDHTAAQALELEGRELLGVDDHPALGAAEGYVDHRALERHPQSEGLDLAEADVGVVADAALGRAPGVVVAHPVGLEGAQRPVVEAHRDGHLEDGLGVPEPLGDLGVDPAELGRLVELADRVDEDVTVVGGGLVVLRPLAHGGLLASLRGRGQVLPPRSPGRGSARLRQCGAVGAVAPERGADPGSG